MSSRDSTDETIRRPLDRVSRPERMRARLLVVYPERLAAVVSLSGGAELVLGRRPGEGGLRLEDPTVSRRHFAIRWDRGRHVGVDLESRNGSRVDGHSAQPGEALELESGSVVRAGDVLMVYEAGAALEARDDERVSRDAVPGAAATTVQLRAQIGAAARDPAPVLLVGETGTGKEHLAREIHRLSGRKGPLVAVNCAALSPQLVESQLFGHARGAFTGADSARDGLVRAAERGTLFLDEIGELPLELQPKLLRVLQEREVHPVGESRAVKVDVRLVSATLSDLAELIEPGRFRLDLYARISPWEIRVPSLAERRADILDWLALFHRSWHETRGLEARALSLEPAAAERLLLHRWDDNLRGLATAVHRALADPAHPALDAPAVRVSTPAERPSRGRAPKPSREALARALAEHGSVRATAKHYGRDRRQIYRWMEQYGLKDEE